jgi:hypothetical protein
LACKACFVFALIPLSQVQASDHIDAPSILIDGRMDISDSYIFQSPSNPDNTVMAMTVNPLAGLLSPTTFNPNVAYDFCIDRNSNSAPDLTIRVRFSGINRFTGKQSVVVRYLYGDNDVVAAVGTTGQDIPLRGGGLIRCDTFDDPFFFDLIGFQNGFDFTGMDYFEGFNVSGIVIEFPRNRVGGRNVGLVAKTLRNGFQQDRVGRPAINTVLIPGNRKNAFNEAKPENDFVVYGQDVEDAITSLSGDRDYAQMITAVLLPDVLTFDQTSDASFLNGRKLADDVIDIELGVLTNGGVTTDMVDANDKPFLNVFPYLAAPH